MTFILSLKQKRIHYYEGSFNQHLTDSKVNFRHYSSRQQLSQIGIQSQRKQALKQQDLSIYPAALNIKGLKSQRNETPILCPMKIVIGFLNIDMKIEGTV